MFKIRMPVNFHGILRWRRRRRRRTKRSKKGSGEEGGKDGGNGGKDKNLSKGDRKFPQTKKELKMQGVGKKED